MGLSVLKKQQIQGLQAQALNQASVTKPLARLATVLELVKPTDQPSYFDGLIQRRQLRHQRLEAAATPLPLQEWLYEGPLSFPIDLRPGASAAAEALASWAP